MDEGLFEKAVALFKEGRTFAEVVTYLVVKGLSEAEAAEVAEAAQIATATPEASGGEIVS